MPEFTVYEYVWALERKSHEITASSLSEALGVFHDGDTDPGYSEVIITMQDSIELETDGGPNEEVRCLEYTEGSLVFDRRGWYGVREASDA